MKKFLGLTAIYFLFPSVAYAADICSSGIPGCECTGAPDQPKDVPSLACFAPIITNVINIAFMFLGAAALIYLLYGSLKFVISRGDQKALQSARNTMTYAVIAVVLILLVYFIANAIATALGMPTLFTNFSLYVENP